MATVIQEIQIPDDVKAAWVKLTPPQRKFILNYFANGCNAAQAYLDAGYAVKDDAVAKSAASRLLNSVNLSSCLYAILKAHRLTPEYADLKHLEALEAEDTQLLVVNGVVERHKRIAWPIRLQALDMLHKIHRRYGKVNGNGNGHGETHVHLTLNVSAPEQELAGGILAAIRSRSVDAAH